MCNFWLIWFINQRALYNHALSVVRPRWRCRRLHRRWHHLCTPFLATGSNIETSYLIYIQWQIQVASLARAPLPTRPNSFVFTYISAKKRCHSYAMMWNIPVYWKC